MFYIEVVQRDFLEDFTERGEMYESKVIEDYIATERTFNFYTYNGKIDVLVLEKKELDELMKDIKIMEMRHEDMCLKKGKKSLTLCELEKIRKYFHKILEDRNFYWEEFCVVAKVEVDIEMLDI